MQIWNKLNPALRNKLEKKVTFVGHVSANLTCISSNDIRVSTIVFCRELQRRYYLDIYGALRNNRKHAYYALGIQTDNNGILRCIGRLSTASLSENTKFPILLPPLSTVTDFIILECHSRLFHAGVSHTLTDIRQTFWIPKGRAAVKKVINSCNRCKRFLGGPFALPPMPALPEERTHQARPFQNTGVDYWGPVTVRNGPDKIKIWVCLFTCLVTRAIHMEIANNLSAIQFLQCLRRFVSRRGWPETLFSDNGTQFTTSAKTLHDAWDNIVNDDECIQYFAKRGIKWRFITEMAPWKGGFYERLIGLVKCSMRKMIGRQILQYNDFNTLLIETEAVINSRPLTYASEELDFNVLRPIDFLLHGAKNGFPSLEEDYEDPEYDPDNREKLIDIWRKNMRNIDKFWKIWSEEYLLSLREKQTIFHRHPRVIAKEIPKVGQIVLVHDENLHRGSWKLGKII
ncbi:unnamed protein product [Toxocara canis]|uniref:Integrase catalytic domain-containing protein n=1 Tax=Toxocara canis TaxID=6265 RepID=A0A183UXW8_TOXCA|nr:unnamed protein product [Toxocara canis]